MSRARTSRSTTCSCFTPPGASNVGLNFGKLDLPVGFERDDEPLNFLVTT